MTKQASHFYVTTPIYYVTAKPHLGSLYSTLLADVLARWNKINGKQVFFLTGTDEHGQKIAQAAQHASKEPKAFVDSFINAYKKTWRDYELEYDYFIRTTDQSHVEAVQQWLLKLLETGDIYKSFYEGWYCTPCETFVVEGHAQGEPLCMSCKRITHAVAEESYFFKLSAYQDKLLRFYNDHPEFILPQERAQEVISFVQSGLKDLSISRTTITWGIPFSQDPKHITYVWADALNNYITAIGYGQKGKEQEFAQWWPADVHVIGKDIVRFHAVYWPAFLMAIGLPLPHHLLVHGWIKIGNEKMSKSLGNAVDPELLYAQYGADPIRYYLTRHMAVNQDTEFSIEDLEQKITSDLANDLGNLLQRIVSLAERYELFNLTHPAAWNLPALELRNASWDMADEFKEYMDSYLFHRALASLWKYIAQVNAYFHQQEPWKIAQSNKRHFQEIMSASCHALYTVSVLLWPIMPRKMEELWHSLGVHCNHSNAFALVEQSPWNMNFKVQKIPALFTKYDIKEIKSVEQDTSFALSEQPHIDITDFSKVVLVVGTIKACAEVPKSHKLFALQVDFGPKGLRQILSGIRQHFSVEQLIGQQGCFVYNLASRMMMNMESQGMMLLVPNEEGKLTIVAPQSRVPNGYQIK